MRIVSYVTPSFPRITQTFIVNKFVGLLKRGWDVHIVTPHIDSDIWEYYPEIGGNVGFRQRVWEHSHTKIKQQSSTTLMSLLLRNFPRSLEYYRSSRHILGKSAPEKLLEDRLLLELRPDLIHFEFAWPARGMGYLKELLGCKLVVSFRSSGFFLSQAEPDFYNNIWQTADAVHFLGRDLRDRANRHGFPLQMKHVLISAAVDTDFFQVEERNHFEVLGGEQRPLKILGVARLNWQKGHEYGLEAIRFLLDKGIHCQYDIVGTGKFEDAILFQRRQLALEDQVRLVGVQTREEVKSRMASADVFLHASVCEGFCNAALEAQAMQLPVVCTDADGLTENVINNETGFVVPRRCPAKLADKMALLAKDPELRQQMSKNGRIHMVRDFQIEDQINAFDQFYRQVLGEAS